MGSNTQDPSSGGLVIHREWPTDAGFTIRQVERFEEPEFTQLCQQIFYRDFPGVEWEKLLSEEERAGHRALKKAFGFPNAIRLGAYAEEKLIGWTVGWQDGESSFYMANSAVLPEYRRQGVYRTLVNTLLDLLREKGFQLIRSRHVATNSPVIIAKLKQGFVINGMELHDAFGTLVQLSYYLNAGRRKLIDVRAGLSRPDAEIASLMN